MGNKPKKYKNSKLPSKKSMNLYQVEITDNSWQRVIPYAIVIIVIVVAFIKLGVFQRISQLNKLREQVSQAQIQLDEINKSIEDYDDVKADYIRYSDHYMLDEGGKLVDRMRIIDLIGDNVYNIGDIKSYTIDGNTVSLEVIVNTLDDVRVIGKQLEAVDWVGNITVNTATKTISATGWDKVIASIVFDAVHQDESEVPVGVSSTVETVGGEEADD
ncbi:MAG: hypothetical protein GX314_01760 [Clostridiaceae bacterium]|nr:hypothetical protein [Clostridiaceae bacterium]